MTHRVRCPLIPFAVLPIYNSIYNNVCIAVRWLDFRARRTPPPLSPRLKASDVFLLRKRQAGEGLLHSGRKYI